MEAVGTSDVEQPTTKQLSRSYLRHSTNHLWNIVRTHGSEGDSLLVEFVEILVVYADVLKLLYFGLLNSLDFFSLHVDFFSNFSAFLQEVKSILLFDIFVGSNLSPDLIRVINECLLSILFDFSLLQLDLLLLLNLVHVVLSFYSSLLGQGRGFLLELLLSCLLEVSLDTLSLGLFKLFSFSSLSFSLFEGSLCSQSIDFSLSIGSFLLELSKSLDLSFFFFSDSLGLLLFFEFLLVFKALVLCNSCILVLLFL